MRKNSVKHLSPPFAPATSISYKTDAFPLPSDVYWIYSMFGATTSHDLVTLTFDLLTLRVYRVQCFSCPTHLPIFIILRLSVTELRVLNIWLHFSNLKQSLRMRSIRWPVHRRSPKTTNNNFFYPELPIHYTTFMGLRWRLRVFYIAASPCLSDFRSQKTKSSQNRSPKWRFFGNLRVQI